MSTTNYAGLNWKYFFRNGNVNQEYKELSYGRRTFCVPSDHKGIDVWDSREIGHETTQLTETTKGPMIFSVCSGTVVYEAEGYNGGMGNCVVIRADQQIGGKPLTLRYMHFAERSHLRKDDKVTNTTFIGYMGGTGESTHNHLHFDVNNTTSYWGNELESPMGSKIPDLNKLINPQSFFSGVVFGANEEKKQSPTPLSITTITWNANGGMWLSNSGTPATRTIISYTKSDPSIGTFPQNPIRDGYFFSGWYTAQTGGSPVTNSTPVPAADTITYHARWTVDNITQNPPTGGDPPTGGTLPVPTGLTVVSTSSDTVTLSWNPVAGALNYGVEREGTPAPVVATSTTYVETDLNASTTYRFRVRAWSADNSQVSVFTDWVSATIET